MQTDSGDTSLSSDAGVLEELAAALEATRAAPADAETRVAALTDAECRLRAAQGRLVGQPAGTLAGLLVRLAMAYSHMEVIAEEGDPLSHDLAAQAGALVGSSLSLLAAASPEASAEVQSLLSFFASSALRGDWHVTEVGWSDDPDHPTAISRGTTHPGVSSGEPDQLAWEAPGESLKRWAQLAAEVETSADEIKETELVLLTIGWLFRTSVGGLLPPRIAGWLATTLQNQLQGIFLQVFSRQERGQPRRKKGKEGETQVRPGAHAMAAACEFHRLAKSKYIVSNAVDTIAKQYGVHRKTVYGWIERAEAGKIMPFGAIITATGSCPDPTNVSSRTEAALVELRHWAAVYRANRARAHPAIDDHQRPEPRL